MTKLDNISPEVKTMLCDLIFQIEHELGEENKQLKEEIQELRADYGNKAQVERDLLQQRIDKAIELLGLMKISEFNREMIETILKGDSNE